MDQGLSRATKAGSVHGAGILLYMTRCIGDRTEVEFVLGQEDFALGWSQGGCWSAFEGGRKGDEAPERTAAREFVEETAGAISINGCHTIAEIEGLLRRREFALCITVDRSNADQEPRLYVYYIVRIPWGTPTKAYFDMVHRPLSALHQLCDSERVAREKRCAIGGTELVDAHQKRVRAVNRAYAELPYFLRTHAAVRVCTAHSVDKAYISVVPDYLEKREVRTFPMHAIDSMLRNREMRSMPHSVRFRYCFIPVIKAAMRQLNDVIDGCR